jgi:hypothetical protein
MEKCIILSLKRPALFGDKMSLALFEMDEEFCDFDDYNEEYGCYEPGVSYRSQVSSVKSQVYPEISDEELSRLMDEAEEWLRICVKPYEICLEELLATTPRVE